MVVRVLALCGFTQNATIYYKQLGGVRKACKDVEFVFLEPPIIVEKADLPWATQMDDFDSTATTEPDQTPETTPRAWWLSSNDRQTYRRFDESVQHIHKVLVEQGPFDGVMGFSQGGCMALIVAALLEKPGALHPLFPAEPSIPKMKFVISVGGFLPAPQNPSFDPYWPLPAALPVLSIIGNNDTVVPSERSHTIRQGALSLREEYHEGGHFTPSKASWRHFFNAYITSFAAGGSKGDIGSPSTFGPSGTNTPATGNGTPRATTPAPASHKQADNDAEVKASI